MDHFWHFWWTFVHSNVNLARFARNVEWDFFCDFQTLCLLLLLLIFFSSLFKWSENGKHIAECEKEKSLKMKKSLINGVNEWEIVRFHLCEIGSIDICQVRHHQRNIENMIPQLGIHTLQNTTEGYFTHSSRSLIFFQDYFRGMSPSFTWVHVARCSFKIQMTFVHKVKEEMWLWIQRVWIFTQKIIFC